METAKKSKLTCTRRGQSQLLSLKWGYGQHANATTGTERMGFFHLRNFKQEIK